ncbi:MAG: hypothetical protein RR346_07190 [Bacteroidales bacterium]
MPTKHGRDAAKEIKTLLKNAVGVKLPIITDTPPHAYQPEVINFTPDDLIVYNTEIDHSEEIGLIQIGLAKDNVRTQKAIHAFEKAGVHPKEFTHLGFYKLNTTTEGSVAPMRYMLLW